MEYRIIEGWPSDCQKTLNQWRNIYFLQILSMTSVVLPEWPAQAWQTILLTREKK